MKKIKTLTILILVILIVSSFHPLNVYALTGTMRYYLDQPIEQETSFPLYEALKSNPWVVVGNTLIRGYSPSFKIPQGEVRSTLQSIDGTIYAVYENSNDSFKTAIRKDRDTLKNELTGVKSDFIKSKYSTPKIALSANVSSFINYLNLADTKPTTSTIQNIKLYFSKTIKMYKTDSQFPVDVSVNYISDEVGAYLTTSAYLPFYSNGIYALSSSNINDLAGESENLLSILESTFSDQKLNVYNLPIPANNTSIGKAYGLCLGNTQAFQAIKDKGMALTYDKTVAVLPQQVTINKTLVDLNPNFTFIINGLKSKDYMLTDEAKGDVLKADYPFYQIDKLELNADKTYEIKYINDGSARINLWIERITVFSSNNGGETPSEQNVGTQTLSVKKVVAGGGNGLFFKNIDNSQVVSTNALMETIEIKGRHYATGRLLEFPSGKLAETSLVNFADPKLKTSKGQPLKNFIQSYNGVNNIRTVYLNGVGRGVIVDSKLIKDDLLAYFNSQSSTETRSLYNVDVETIKAYLLTGYDLNSMTLSTSLSQRLNDINNELGILETQGRYRTLKTILSSVGIFLIFYTFMLFIGYLSDKGGGFLGLQLIPLLTLGKMRLNTTETALEDKHYISKKQYKIMMIVLAITGILCTMGVLYNILLLIYFKLNI